MSFLPDCRDMSRRLSEIRDTGRALRPGERLHLWLCDVCRRLRFQLALIGRGARRPPEGGPALTPQAKERLRRAVDGSSSA
jgi:hypothetical protein